MKNRWISIGIVFLLVIGGFTGFLYLSPINAQGTNVSGVVFDGAGGPWTVAGSPYIVVGDVIVPQGQTLTIEPGAHVKFDGFYNIFADGTFIAIGTEANRINITSNMAVPSHGDWYRIQINSTGHAEIKYCDISYGDSGVYLSYSSYNNITKCNFSSNKWGIYLFSSSNNNITENYVLSNYFYGIYLYYSSSNNTITNNNVSNNRDGIYLSESLNTVITNNNLKNDGVTLFGTQISHFNSHTIPYNNFVNGKRLYYYKDCEGLSIDGVLLGQLILANCTNIEVKNLQINNTDIGIQITYSSNILITGNNVSNNRVGMSLSLSSNNIVSNNTILNISQHGIYLIWSSNNTIKDNDISDIQFGIVLVYSSNINITSNNVSNSKYGLEFVKSSNNTASGNNISNNDSGIVISQSSNNTIIDNNVIFSLNKWGFELFLSSDNYIIGNDVSNNMYAFALSYSLNNTITGNYVSNNDVGIFLEDSSNNNTINENTVLMHQDYGFFLWLVYNNSIYHNNIIDNSIQAYDNTNKGNQWDNGYPLGGNYWSNYGGVDNFKGPNQDIPGYDGIGDTHYAIDGNSHDNYPLIEPYKPLESYTILNQGWNLISIPLIQVEQNLTRVLGSIEGWYDAIQWYDITDTNDPWKHHKVDKPFGNDLSKINETMGFWIHITHPGDTIFLHNGTLPSKNQTIILHPGWNLVGYPSLRSYNRTQGLNNLTFGQEIDSIWTYNAITQKWKEIGPFDIFELGRGYWIHSKIRCEWEVPL